MHQSTPMPSIDISLSHNGDDQSTPEAVIDATELPIIQTAVPITDDVDLTTVDPRLDVTGMPIATNAPDSIETRPVGTDMPDITANLATEADIPITEVPGITTNEDIIETLPVDTNIPDITANEPTTAEDSQVNIETAQPLDTTNADVPQITESENAETSSADEIPQSTSSIEETGADNPETPSVTAVDEGLTTSPNEVEPTFETAENHSDLSILTTEQSILTIPANQFTTPKSLEITENIDFPVPTVMFTPSPTVSEVHKTETKNYSMFEFY